MPNIANILKTVGKVMQKGGTKYSQEKAFGKMGLSKSTALLHNIRLDDGRTIGYVDKAMQKGSSVRSVVFTDGSVREFTAEEIRDLSTAAARVRSAKIRDALPEAEKLQKAQRTLDWHRKLPYFGKESTITLASDLKQYVRKVGSEDVPKIVQVLDGRKTYTMDAATAEILQKAGQIKIVGEVE